MVWVLEDLIKKQVRKLVKKHKTNNPFEIAKEKNIIVIREPLGSIYGYYNKYARQRFIHINCNLDYHREILTCAHELGHIILHPNSNTPFLKANTFYSISKLERQANLFAAHLLIDDNLLDNYKGYTLEQIALMENIPIELLHLRFF